VLDELDLILQARTAAAAVIRAAISAVVTWLAECDRSTWQFGLVALADLRQRRSLRTAIHHAALASVLYNVNAYAIGEAGDWNLRVGCSMPGLPFDFLECIVTSNFVDDNAPGVDWWRVRLAERGSFPS
jgi:hypothetical protein